jgi:hypothetical protein
VSEKTSEQLVEMFGIAAVHQHNCVFDNECDEADVDEASEAYDAAQAALLSRIRELEADAARLDWVAEHLYASVSHGDDSFTIDWYDEEGYEQHTRMPAFREAIDAARSPESKTEGAKP